MWDDLGEPESKVEEWKRWGFTPVDIIDWRKAIAAAIDEHSAALETMRNGEWPGVDPSDVTRAVADARRSASEKSDPYGFGFGVIGSGSYPYPSKARQRIPEGDWNEFLVVVSDGKRDAVFGAALPAETVEPLRQRGELETTLVAHLAERAQTLADAGPAFNEILMFITPVWFRP
jgi:hypothetical protein